MKHDGPITKLALECLLFLLSVSAAVLLPLDALIARPRKRRRPPSPAMRRALWVGWIVSALDLVFLVVMVLSFGEPLIYGVPLPMRVMLVIPVVTSILSVVILALTIIAWMRGYGSLGGRLYHSLVALALVVFVLFVEYWNMLGWRFQRVDSN